MPWGRVAAGKEQQWLSPVSLGLLAQGTYRSAFLTAGHWGQVTGTRTIKQPIPELLVSVNSGEQTDLQAQQFPGKAGGPSSTRQGGPTALREVTARSGRPGTVATSRRPHGGAHPPGPPLPPPASWPRLLLAAQPLDPARRLCRGVPGPDCAGRTSPTPSRASQAPPPAGGCCLALTYTF